MDKGLHQHIVCWQCISTKLAQYQRYKVARTQPPLRKQKFSNIEDIQSTPISEENTEGWVACARSSFVEPHMENTGSPQCTLVVRKV